MGRVTKHEVVFTKAEIQERFKIGEKTVTQLIRDGTFKARSVRAGSRRSKILVQAESVYVWLNDPQASLAMPRSNAQAEPSAHG